MSPERMRVARRWVERQVFERQARPLAMQCNGAIKRTVVFIHRTQPLNIKNQIHDERQQRRIGQMTALSSPLHPPPSLPIPSDRCIQMLAARNLLRDGTARDESTFPQRPDPATRTCRHPPIRQTLLHDPTSELPPHPVAVEHADLV
jgi:hypothetical protein